MSQVSLKWNRTGWDVAIGLLLVVLGVVVLANAAVATTVSVLFLGWLLVAAGLLGLVGALFLVGQSGFWSAVLGGGLLTILGVAVLRNTDATAVTLTLIAGVVFLVSGVLRLATAVQVKEYRWPLLIAGACSTVLGLLVVFHLVTASYLLLGVLVGVQMIVDGLAMALMGRMHVVPANPTGGPMAVAR